jgi:hypothetical protein
MKTRDLTRPICEAWNAGKRARCTQPAVVQEPLVEGGAVRLCNGHALAAHAPGARVLLPPVIRTVEISRDHSTPEQRADFVIYSDRRTMLHRGNPWRDRDADRWERAHGPSLLP